MHQSHTAQPCRYVQMYNAIPCTELTCRMRRRTVSDLSCIGPSILRARLMTVRLLHSAHISPSLSKRRRCARPREEATPRKRPPGQRRSLSLKTLMLIPTVSVAGSYLGSRCRGQGTRWNSWGTEYTKFATWSERNAILIRHSFRNGALLLKNLWDEEEE